MTQFKTRNFTFFAPRTVIFVYKYDEIRGDSEKVEEFLELIPKKLKNFWN